MAVVPKQKPGRSEQNVQTPPDLLKAIRHKFLQNEDFAYDLAADAANAVVESYFTMEDDALIQDWARIHGSLWCNPPYSDIEPWVSKACLEAEKGAVIFMLLPASVGSNWWRNYVDRQARVYFLNGRPTFVGHTSPYPKDLALLIYNMYPPLYKVWNWRLDI